MKPKSFLIMLIAATVVISCKKKTEEEDPNALNRWDGRYMVSGTLVDVVAPTITSPGPKEYHLRTISPTEVDFLPVELGILGHLILSGGSLSYYGSFGLILTFDRTSNKITSITNSYGQPSPNGRYAILDPSGINAWDPATKTIKIKYWMDQPSVVAGHRTSFDETWTYISKRDTL